VPPARPHAPPARRRPPGRYDEPSLVGQRILAVLLGGMFVALVVSIVLAFYSRFGREEVRVQEIGFSVLSDTEVRVDFAVSFAADEPAQDRAYCTVRSRDQVGREIGRQLVEVGRTGDRVVVAHVLETSRRAVTGEVDGCSLQPPPGAARP
jgi:hypothetical protein